MSEEQEWEKSRGSVKEPGRGRGCELLALVLEGRVEKVAVKRVRVCAKERER